MASVSRLLLAGAIALSACTRTRNEVVQPAPPPPPPPTPSPTFTVAARTTTSSTKTAPVLRPCLIEGAAFVCAAGSLGEIRGGSLVWDPALLEGLPRDARGGIDGVIRTIVGKWPDAAVLALGHRDGDDAVTFHRWSGSKWAPLKTAFHVPRAGAAEAPWFARPWTKGRLLIAAGYLGVSFGTLLGDAADLPVPFPSGKNGDEDGCGATRMLMLSGMVAQPTGEVIALGRACEGGDMALETWGRGGAHTFTKAPSGAVTIVPTRASPLLVGGADGHALVARIVDGAIQSEPGPDDEIGDAAGDGELLWAIGKKLWLRTGTAPWRAIDLPSPCGAREARLTTVQARDGLVAVGETCGADAFVLVNRNVAAPQP